MFAHTERPPTPPLCFCAWLVGGTTDFSLAALGLPTVGCRVVPHRIRDERPPRSPLAPGLRRSPLSPARDKKWIRSITRSGSASRRQQRSWAASRARRESQCRRPSSMSSILREGLVKPRPRRVTTHYVGRIRKVTYQAPPRGACPRPALPPQPAGGSRLYLHPRRLARHGHRQRPLRLP